MIALSSTNTVRFGSLIPVTGGKLIDPEDASESPLSTFEVKPYMSALAASINLPINDDPFANQDKANTQKQIIGALKAMDLDFQMDPQVLAAVDWRGGADQWKLYLITGQKDIAAFIANFTKSMQDQMTTFLQQAIQGRTAAPDYRLPNELKLPEVKTYAAQAEALDRLKHDTTEHYGIRVVLQQESYGRILKKVEPNA